MKKLIILALTLSLSNYSWADALFKVNSTAYDYKYEGLTPAGLSKLKILRDALRTRQRMFNDELLGLQSVHHAVTVARAVMSNMFIYGPPGGGKSAVVEWFLKSERNPAFEIQMHQMMTEQTFVGGQNFEKAKEGVIDINTEGSLANFEVALIDEMDKGNPAALASLLSLLNERKVLAGNKKIKANTETVFATSNANLPEMFEQFRDAGQASTLPALLNRFQFKAFLYNWLSIDDQIALDKRRQRKNYLKLVSAVNPDALNDALFLETPKVDWQDLRVLSGVMFKVNDIFESTSRELAAKIREQTYLAVRESEAKHKKNRFETPFIYFPSCEMTERLRGQIEDVVRVSAFIDFLLSDLANDENLEIVSAKPITLGPLSLWRSYLLETTIGPGTAKLAIADDGTVKMSFAFDINDKLARDAREELLIRNLKEEQKRFAEIYVNQMANLQEHIKQAVKFLSAGNSLEKMGEFELYLINQ